MVRVTMVHMTAKQDTQAATIRFPSDVYDGLKIISDTTGLSINALAVSGAEKIIETFTSANTTVGALYESRMTTTSSLRSAYSSTAAIGDLAPKSLTKWTSTPEEQKDADK